MRILIAHPSRALRDRTREVFGELGWEVLEASGAADALRLCQAHEPDVALLDAGMSRPGSALNVLDELKACSGQALPRVVLLEDELDLEAALAALESGVDEYLTAPVTGPEAVIRVRTALRVKQLEDHLLSQRSDFERLVHADPLTELPNRRFLGSQLDALISSARRHGRPLVVLVIDIDDFKDINDTYGHPAGDAALKVVATALRDRLRTEDMLGRWGGDELLAVLPDIDAAAAALVAETLREAVQEAAGELPRPLSVSIGAAVWTGEDADQLIARADTALYDAKHAGRNRIAFAAAPSLATSDPVDPQPAAEARSTLGLLLVDDIAELRLLLAAHLRSTHLAVLGEASDGIEALELAERLRPDAVVMDMHMPGMDGVQAARLLTARHPEIVVVAFTSTEDPRIAEAMREAGVVRQFHKGQVGDLVAYLRGDDLAEVVHRRRDPR